ncbi:LptA/OstA family protein [uncultured Algimonas sp.]|uniref:LptA/OstA family protein n=1 Tax=uncultured Algimonas sp. TaxID=1547920 RepID=UPI0026070BFB|nr:LptA/OstA family protein [uncultured Algimonas sp.]
MKRALAGLFVILIGGAQTANAQFARAGGDTLLYADDVESVDGVITLTGQADVRQGDVRILADEIVIHSRQDGGASAGPSVGTVADDIDRVIATGNFFYITPEQEVRGNQGVYTAADDTFVVTGDVILTQEDSVVRGTRLIYELNTQKARVVTDCQGRRCPTQERVAILIRDTSQAGAETGTPAGSEAEAAGS